MEVHFVHQSEAGDLLVIGALINAGDANPALTTLWPLIPAARGTATSVATVDPLALIPDELEAYRYAGSLTTPPCSEVVTWNVMAEPITASQQQIDAVAAIYPSNFRPIQHVGRRFVLASK